MLLEGKGSTIQWCRNLEYYAVEKMAQCRGYLSAEEVAYTLLTWTTLSPLFTRFAVCKFKKFMCILLCIQCTLKTATLVISIMGGIREDEHFDGGDLHSNVIIILRARSTFAYH